MGGDKYPLIVRVVRLTGAGKTLQNYNAEDMRHAMTIVDREQGKPDVFAVDIHTAVYSWRRQVNVNTDGTIRQHRRLAAR